MSYTTEIVKGKKINFLIGRITIPGECVVLVPGTTEEMVIVCMDNVIRRLENGSDRQSYIKGAFELGSSAGSPKAPSTGQPVE